MAKAQPKAPISFKYGTLHVQLQSSCLYRTICASPTCTASSICKPGNYTLATLTIGKNFPVGEVRVLLDQIAKVTPKLNVLISGPDHELNRLAKTLRGR